MLLQDFVPFLYQEFMTNLNFYLINLMIMISNIDSMKINAMQ